MDIVIGIIVWGGLLWLVLAWFARAGRSEASGRGADAGPSQDRTGTSAAGPGPPGVDQRLPDEQKLRVDDALVDGLVIGHFLTRDHYERRLEDLEDALDEWGHTRDPWLDGGLGDDDLDDGTDYAEFDAMGGFGVEPWADDLFDLDDED